MRAFWRRGAVGLLGAVLLSVSFACSHGSVDVRGRIYESETYYPYNHGYYYGADGRYYPRDRDDVRVERRYYYDDRGRYNDNHYFHRDRDDYDPDAWHKN